MIFLTGEIPKGAVDGFNTVFTLAHKPIAWSLAVFQEGARLLLGEDYFLSGNTITFIIPPEPFDLLQADYRHQA